MGSRSQATAMLTRIQTCVRVIFQGVSTYVLHFRGSDSKRTPWVFASMKFMSYLRSTFSNSDSNGWCPYFGRGQKRGLLIDANRGLPNMLSRIVRNSMMHRWTDIPRRPSIMATMLELFSYVSLGLSVQHLDTQTLQWMPLLYNQNTATGEHSEMLHVTTRWVLDAL